MQNEMSISRLGPVHKPTASKEQKKISLFRILAQLQGGWALIHLRSTTVSIGNAIPEVHGRIARPGTSSISTVAR